MKLLNLFQNYKKIYKIIITGERDLLIETNSPLLTIKIMLKNNYNLIDHTAIDTLGNTKLTYIFNRKENRNLYINHTVKNEIAPSIQ